MIGRLVALGSALAAPFIGRAAALEPVTYMFPAPPSLPAFIPHQVAMRRGYFAEAGLKVTFESGQGGASVATHAGAGTATLCGGVGETSMIVRPNGVPVRAVALLGGKPLYSIAVRRDAGIADLAGLRGMRIGTIGYQDTGFYALLGVMAAHRLRPAEAEIRSVGVAGMTRGVIEGALDGIVAVPEFIDAIEEAGVPLDVFAIDRFFPAMSQAILTSDTTALTRPAAVAGFVQAVLRSVRECREDPAAAARDFVAQVPQHAGREAAMERILRRYVAGVYPTEPGAPLGRFDAERLRRVQRFYLDNEIVRTAVSVEELYSNDFAG